MKQRVQDLELVTCSKTWLEEMLSALLLQQDTRQTSEKLISMTTYVCIIVSEDSNPEAENSLFSKIKNEVKGGLSKSLCGL